MEKVKALRDSLIEKTGIDFEIYRNYSDGISNKIVGLINFPNYFLRTMLKSIIISFVAYVVFAIVLFQWGNSALMAILFLIIGLIPLSFVGSIQGLVNFLKRLKEDLSGILKLSLEMIHSVLDDIRRTSEGILEMPKTSEIISGVILIVIVPSLNQIIRKRILFVGGFVVKLIDFVLDKMTVALVKSADDISQSDTVQKLDDNQEKLTDEVEAKIAKYHETSLNILEKVTESSDSIMQEVFGKVMQPFRKLLIIGYVITVGYIIAVIMILN